MRIGTIRAGQTLASLAFIGIFSGCEPKARVEVEPLAEARTEGQRMADFPETEEDIFAGMDQGVALEPDEAKGRNTWLTWTAGNEAFWDHLARHGYGLVDLLETLDSRRRGSRFKEMGLINEPGFRQAQKPDEYGLWLDERITPEAAGSNSQIDGRASGIVGLRLFPNPEFEAARGQWDAERYEKDAAYRASPELIRPYRVGMSCAFCHVAFHPLHPPADPENPDWKNLSSIIGNQYWRTSGVFGAKFREQASFVYQMLDSAKPGTVDTSLLATDGNNNPTAINPLFQLSARLARAQKNRPEQVSAGGAALESGGDLRQVPHILADGADSIGVIGAMMRVYVSIGAFHQQWLPNHNLLVGLQPQKPFDIAATRRSSVYWQATEARMPNVVKFLTRVSQPMPLAAAPGGAAFLTRDEAVLERGKIVFAEHCVSCHSSKQPDGEGLLDPAQRRELVRTDEYLSWARTEVLKPDFLNDNFLSTDQRHPVTSIKTHAGRALADNATQGHVWSEFSSETYRTSPSVGSIEVRNPFDGARRQFPVPAGGPGYYRVPTLVGIWATAPFLHNNALGQPIGDPSAEGRLRAFNDAIEKLLWLEKRDGEKSILRTSGKTWLRVPVAALPAGGFFRGFWNSSIFIRPWLLLTLLALAGLAAWISIRRRSVRIASVALVAVMAILLAVGAWLVEHRRILVIGPIPDGTPIDLLTNLNPPVSDPVALSKLVGKIQRVLQESQDLSDDEARRHLREQLGADLLELSKSPDFIEDRGHPFGTSLPDADKRALIEFLKTM